LLFAHVAPEEEHTRKPKSASAVAGLRPVAISALHLRELVDRGRRAPTEDRHHDAETDGDLRAATTITKKTIA